MGVPVAPIPWRVLTEVYTKTAAEDLFLQKTLLPPTKKILLPTDTVTFRKVKAPMSVASLSVPGDPPKRINTMYSYEEVTYKVLQIFEEDQIDVTQAAYDWRLTSIDAGILNSASDVAKSLQALYEPKLAELKNRINRRIELMLAQILTTGQISYDDGLRTIVRDYGPILRETVRYEQGKFLFALKEVVEKFRESYGGLPDMMIVSPDVYDKFINDPQVEKFINKNTFGWGNINPKIVSANTVYLGAFPEFEIPDMYVYQGFFIDHVTKEKVRYIPDNTIILVAKDVFRIAYGAIIDFEINPDGRPIMQEVLVKETIENRGTTKVISVLTRPLPYIVDPHGVMAVEVI
ncbi:MAG: major capsid protein [Thermofilaceae archaeon]